MITVTTDAGAHRTIRGLLFDMDGTLVNSTEATARIWNGWAADHGVTEGFTILHGQPAIDTIRRSFPDADEDRIELLNAAVADAECVDLDGVAPMAGAYDLLEWIEGRGLPWAIVTGSGTLLARARLEASAITPPVLVSCDDTERGKPDPQPYQRAASLIGVPIEECLVVEDAPAGVAAGLSSGAVTAALNDLPGDVRIADLNHLRDLLRRSLTD